MVELEELIPKFQESAQFELGIKICPWKNSFRMAAPLDDRARRADSETPQISSHVQDLMSSQGGVDSPDLAVNFFSQ